MILHRVTAANVGPFVGPPVVAGPFAPGLNILAAPNETGKTTLLKAAGRALFDRHTCTAREIKNLRPVGTALAPVVTVDFTTVAGRFRVEKTFLQSFRSELHEYHGADDWRLVADGDAADDRLNALLQSSKPGRGATEIAHWGMLGYLWTRQGELAEWPEWHRNAAGQLVQGMLVKVEIDPFIEAVRERLWAAYLENFTPATGQPKAGGTLLAAEAKLARVEEELAEIAGTRQQLQADEETYLRLADELPRREAEHAACRREADRLREAANQVAVLTSEAEKSRQAFETAQDRLRAVRRDADALEHHAREGTELARQFATAETDLQRRQQATVRAEDAIRTLETAREENAAALAVVQAAVHRSGRLAKHRQTAENAARHAAALERCNAEVAAIETSTRARAEIPTVPPAKLRSLEKLAESVRTNRARVEALSLSVELLPSADVVVTARTDEAPAAALPVIRAGATHVLRAVGSAVLDLPGWGQVRVRSGAGEARALGETLAVDEATLRSELSELGAPDVETMRGFVETARALDARLSAAHKALAAVLGGEETADALRTKLAGERRQLQALEDELGLTDEERAVSRPDLDAAEQRALVQSESRRQEQKELDHRLKAAREAAGDAARAGEQAERALLTLRLQQENLQRQSADILARYPEGLQAARDAAEETFVEAKIIHQRAQAKLPPDADTLPDRHRRAAAAVEQVHGELTRKRDTLAALRGRLELLGSQSLHSREAACQAERETLAAQVTHARARSRAARLVHDLIARRKQAATLAVLAPLQERLGARFAQVSGERDRRVFLDQSLAVRGLGRKDGELVHFADLSQGAKEQLLLCLRLAIAEELAGKGEGPQSLILDDVLVNTDADRQQRVLDLLSDAAGRGLQILVCTCHPDRYRGIGEVIDLRREG